jgi:plastocyanin
MKLEHKREGIGAGAVIAAVIVVILIAGAAYFIFAPSSTSTTNATTSTTTTSTTPPTSSTSTTTSTTTSTSSSTSTTTNSSSSGATVILPQGVGSDQSLNFQPSKFTLVVGVNNTVTFEDQDNTAPHNVWFTSIPSGATNPNTADNQQTGYEILKGQSVSYTLTTPGTYTFECQFHSSWMQGTITVTG